MLTDAILTLNAGSSSIKFALYAFDHCNEGPLISGKIDGIGRAPDFKARDASGRSLIEDGLEAIENTANHAELTLRLLDWLRDHDGGVNVVAVGHRVVHGGRFFAEPVLVDAEVVRELDSLVPLAPLHQPNNLAAIRAISDWTPGLPQVACFDTSFHRMQLRLAQLFGLPRVLSDTGLVRYGFHGLSYEYIARVLPEHLGARSDARVIVAHLGNGASLCAMKNRQSVATTMGFTALHGLMMGRRCGTLDAGVVLHLLQERGMSVDEVHHLLYRESGLLGVSGVSNSMQILQESADPHAREAIELFCYRAACEFGSLAAALEGIDAIVFTAGIGENCEQVRRIICSRLAWLGVELDPVANQMNATVISRKDSRIDVLVIPTVEESVIADATRSLIESSCEQRRVDQ